ncbi:hypothetical protein ABEV55_14730 [Aneurinibacillus thermoaerophilus]|uniref:hypothetical protein n=1 Tax=Aneurinibacillus thermoaerophilus TaxID=143495 RepID=UPI002E212F90|nr:hypothetical protein [Aneurinibacillus thermoaerophilus]
MSVQKANSKSKKYEGVRDFLFVISIICFISLILVGGVYIQAKRTFSAPPKEISGKIIAKTYIPEHLETWHRVRSISQDRVSDKHLVKIDKKMYELTPEEWNEVKVGDTVKITYQENAFVFSKDKPEPFVVSVQKLK